MQAHVPVFYDYYWDLLTYLSQRKQRTEVTKRDLASSVRVVSGAVYVPPHRVPDALQRMSDAEKEEAFRVYLGKERALLRQRRTKLKLTDFHVLTQIGQGGYGAVRVWDSLWLGQRGMYQRDSF